MGCGNPQEKLENEIMEMNINKIEIQMERYKQMKLLGEKKIPNNENNTKLNNHNNKNDIIINNKTNSNNNKINIVTKTSRKSLKLKTKEVTSKQINRAKRSKSVKLVVVNNKNL